MALLLSSALFLQMASASNLRWVTAENGRVPPFAVVGGENFSGEPLYVARVMLKHGWTAGKMAPSYGVAHAAWDGKELYRKKYQILTNPGWKSHLVWMKNDGNSVPSGAVVAGKDGEYTLHVGRFMYTDGHMICGEASFDFGKCFIGYNNKEFESTDFYVLVEKPQGHFKRSMFPELPGVKQLKRTPIKKQQDEE